MPRGSSNSLSRMLWCEEDFIPHRVSLSSFSSSWEAINLVKSQGPELGSMKEVTYKKEKLRHLC